MERDGEKMLEYYDKSRLDGLLKLEVGPEYVREYYEYRQNRYIESRLQFTDKFIFIEL